MMYLQLFWSFLKIGFTSFGGLSMIPLIREEVLSHGWMTAQEVSDIVAIAEMTPGPLGLNCATFAGIHAAGILGAVVANLGVLMPTFTLGALAAAAFQRFSRSSVLQRMMVGIRPICAALVFGVCISLTKTNYTTDGQVSISALLIGAVAAVLLFGKHMGIGKVLAISGLLGLLCSVLPVV